MAGYGETARAEAPAGPCANNCFVLTSMTIQGVTAYPLADLASTYDQQLARQIGVDDLVQAASAITDRYRRDGYFLTRAVVAPIEAFDGSATIVVYEGYIGDVVVEGSGARAVRPILEPIAGRRALTIGELDRRLALASDIPGVKVTSRIEPYLNDPAQHRLVVEAVLDRYDAGAYVDNRGSPAQGPWQVYVNAGVNSAVVDGDRLTFAALTVPNKPDELTFAEWGYTAPIGGGRSFRASVSGYSTDAPNTAANNWMGGKSRAASIGVSQPIIRGRRQSVWLNAGLDVRRVEQIYSNSNRSVENLSVGRVSLNGRKQWSVGSVTAFAQLSQGLDLFGATTETSPGRTRSDADAVFTKANFNASLYRDIGRYVGVYAEVSGQWSEQPLLASEEFYIGGPNVGRAYNYGEISGDKGVAGSVELRLGWDPKLAPISFFQVFAFYDAGSVSNFGPTGETYAHLSSAGVGSRITLDRTATLKVELAKPLSRTPYTEDDNGWRAFFSLSKQF